MLLVGLMYGRLQCLYQNGLGGDLVDFRCCESNGTEPVSNDRTSMVSATVSARKNRNGIVSHMFVVLKEKSARQRWTRVAAIDVVITAESWNIYVWKGVSDQ